MILKNYDDSRILHDKLIIIQNSMISDSEIDFEDQGELVTESMMESHEQSIGLREDMARLNVVKSGKTSLPTYEITKTSSSKKKEYALSKNGRSSFLVSEGTIIRKSTALYILQENAQISNDSLLRVRANQSNELQQHTRNLCSNRRFMSIQQHLLPWKLYLGSFSAVFILVWHQKRERIFI